MKSIKKFFGFLVIGIASFNLFAAAPSIDSKNGYKSLLWGTSIQTAKLSGFDLKKIDDEDLVSEQKKFKREIKIYSVENISEAFVQKTLLYFCDDKLISVIESLDNTMTKQSKLESRYGKFKQNGINSVGTNNYTDQILEGNNVKKETISIVVTANNVITYLYDWESYSKINKDALAKSGNAGIVDELDGVANELLSKIDCSTKKSFAFVALNSDDKNTFVENYITDALTEAIFSSGKVKIIERANLEKILEEQKFQSTSLVDDKSAKSIGNIAGVDYVCYGNYKKMGEQFNVVVRVVDVESGEVVAISRATVNKDKYLVDAEQKIIAEQKAEQERIQNEKKARYEAVKKRAESSNWKIEKVRNDFDGVTVYTCTNTLPDGAFIFFGYEAWDNPVNSKVRASVSPKIELINGMIDIKQDNGEVYQQKFKVMENRSWYKNKGFDSSNKSNTDYIRVRLTNYQISKNLYPIIINNDYLSIRDANGVRKFQTFGLLESLALYGVSIKDIESAFANEEF